MVVKIKYVEEKTHYCDICDEELENDNFHNFCKICGRECCYNHRKYVSTDDLKEMLEKIKEIKYVKSNIWYYINISFGEDVCNICFEMKEQFLKKLINAIMEGDRKSGKVTTDWKEKSLNVKIEKNEKKETNRAELMDLE